jgi:hypothetical protein
MSADVDTVAGDFREENQEGTVCPQQSSGFDSWWSAFR